MQYHKNNLLSFMKLTLLEKRRTDLERQVGGIGITDPEKKYLWNKKKVFLVCGVFAPVRVRHS